MMRTTFGTESEAQAQAMAEILGADVRQYQVPEVHDDEYRLVTFWGVESE